MKYSEFSKLVERLDSALQKLTTDTSALTIVPLEHREWHELLVQKLLPQIRDHASLIVAVVGGTNIGKSVIFNHLAGSNASATSPLASGTKHPTCLVPKVMDDDARLKEIFQGFELVRSDQPEDALQESETDFLFWRTDDNMPDNLLVLDTPDIDSDAAVNWSRADKIRRSADVLVAVLTQQKYNDAAVKRFFKSAQQEKKLVIIVFNQCLLPEDEAYWAHWMKTFCSETGIMPEHLYLAPHDRKAAEENRLPFYERDWNRATMEVLPEAPVSQAAAGSSISSESESPRSLLDDLATHRFEEIKFQTLQGSVDQLLAPQTGLPSYLKEIVQGSDDFRRAAEILSSHKLAEIEDWSLLPNSLLVGKIRHWWSEQREGWSASVHGFYNALGTGLTYPFKAAKNVFYGEGPPPFEEYQKQEWRMMVKVVEKLYTKLTWMSELDNSLLKPRLEKVLQGQSRQELLNHLKEAHDSVDLSWEVTRLVETELESFRDDSPDFYKFFKRLDSIAAASRPVTSVILFVTGFGPLGEAMMPFIANSATQTALHVAGDVAAGTVTAAVGETALSSTASSGVGYLEAKFRHMHEAFVERRANWLTDQIKTHLLGNLTEELRTAAQIPNSVSYKEVSEICELLRTASLDLQPSDQRTQVAERTLAERTLAERTLAERTLAERTLAERTQLSEGETK